MGQFKMRLFFCGTLSSLVLLDLTVTCLEEVWFRSYDGICIVKNPSTVSILAEKTTRLACSLHCVTRGCSAIIFEDGICHLGGEGLNALPNGNGWTMSEFKTSLSEYNISNVAFQKTANGKNLFDSRFSAAYAVDGGPEMYHSAGQTPKEWWMVDLGKNFPLEKVKITLRKNFVSRFSDVTIYLSPLYTSPDDHSLLPVFARQQGPAGGSVVEYAAEKLMCGQYVVIQKDVDGVLELIEVEVFAYSS